MWQAPRHGDNGYADTAGSVVFRQRFAVVFSHSCQGHEARRWRMTNQAFATSVTVRPSAITARTPCTSAQSRSSPSWAGSVTHQAKAPGDVSAELAQKLLVPARGVEPEPWGLRGCCPEADPLDSAELANQHRRRWSECPYGRSATNTSTSG